MNSKQMIDRANALDFAARSMRAKADRLDANTGPSWDAERIRDEASAVQAQADALIRQAERTV